MKTASRRMKRTIRAADGTYRTLYSFDGIHWCLDSNDARRRITAAMNLTQKYWSWRLQKWVDREPAVQQSREGLHGPVILPVEHHGSPFMGKEKGKAQKHRRNLKAKKERHIAMQGTKAGFAGIGRIPRNNHFHRCHNKRYACNCDTPWLKRPCGGTFCLVN